MCLIAFDFLFSFSRRIKTLSFKRLGLRRADVLVIARISQLSDF
jgi:hypothetical protein